MEVTVVPSAEMLDAGKLSPVLPTLSKGKISTNKGDTKVAFKQLENVNVNKNPLNRVTIMDMPQHFQFEDLLGAEEVDGLVAATFRLNIEQILKEGYEIIGTNTELASTIESRLRLVCKLSETTLDSLIRHIAVGIVKFNNALVVIVRKDLPGDRFRPYRINNNTYNPIIGIFPVDPQYMFPRRREGRLSEWRYVNLELASTGKLFPADQVVHFHMNRTSNNIFGTPWILPAMDDVRLLRRMEEFIQMLISKHLFPLFQYKIGTKEQPSVDFADGTSEITHVEQRIGELPQQGCIFTSHRHEIIAIDTNKGLDIGIYLDHYRQRALSSLGLSTIDIGMSDSSNRSTASVLNQTRVDRCSMMQKIIAETFNDKIIFPMIMEMGLNPFDTDNHVELRFNPIDKEEQRKQGEYTLRMFQSDVLTHDEMRRSIGRKPFQSENEWLNVFSNTTGFIKASMQAETKEMEANQKALLQRTTPANKQSPGGSTRPKAKSNS